MWVAPQCYPKNTKDLRAGIPEVDTGSREESASKQKSKARP